MPTTAIVPILSRRRNHLRARADRARFGLQPLQDRDANAYNLLDVLDFAQRPRALLSLNAAMADRHRRHSGGGLIPAVAADAESGEVLTMGVMNAQAGIREPQ